jgi:hypothetical protein
MADTFRIVTADGQPLGTAELARRDWPAGSVIYRGRGKSKPARHRCSIRAG